MFGLPEGKLRCLLFVIPAGNLLLQQSISKSQHSIETLNSREATCYRIPDICLVSLDAPHGLIITDPPILCIEILSREDRMTDMIKRSTTTSTWAYPPSG